MQLQTSADQVARDIEMKKGKTKTEIDTLLLYEGNKRKKGCAVMEN